MIGELYEHALAGWIRPVVERADGSRTPLPVDGWLHQCPADQSILDRCQGPTLAIGSGPGRRTAGAGGPRPGRTRSAAHAAAP